MKTATGTAFLGKLKSIIHGAGGNVVHEVNQLINKYEGNKINLHDFVLELKPIIQHDGGIGATIESLIIETLADNFEEIPTKGKVIIPRVKKIKSYKDILAKLKARDPENVKSTWRWKQSKASELFQAQTA